VLVMLAWKVLEAACIHAPRGQGIPSRVPKHMHMDWERQVCDLAAALNYAGDAHTGERLTALVHEHIY
jgi:hypothetical protein